MRDILLASGNPDKAREICEIMAGHAGRLSHLVRWRSLQDFPPIPEPLEDADTFLGNATLKALAYARATGLWTIADDSGLEVDALGGAPGVHSAHYAGRKGDYAANNRKLIESLAGVPPGQRTARFRCVVVLSDGERTLATAEGRVEGRIIDEARGTNGFGYDPHFWVPELGCTLAELPPARKHAVSHRGRALRLLAEQLEKMLA